MSTEPPRMLEARFHDISTFGEAIGWNLDFRQLESGSFIADVVAESGPHCALLRFAFNRSLHQVGSSPDGQWTFGIPAVDTDTFGWCGLSVKGGDLLNFNLENGFESTTPSTFRGHTVSFERVRLLELADRMELPEAPERLIRNFSAVRSPRNRLLASSLDRWLNHLSLNPGIPPRQHAQVHDEIGMAILQSLVDDSQTTPNRTHFNQPAVLRKALEVLDDPDQLPVSVAQLSREANCSVSTLQRAFMRAFGITPKQYIKSRCLSAVRDDLASAAPETLIADVANRWGFWHMGQFARDYRKQFAELPNETLQRA